MLNINNNQTLSKKRITDHGEVFTAAREVASMLNLVQQETERIEARFLEPACGNGNFLVEILRRKLESVKKRYLKNQIEYERYSIIALSSIYGVDILADNVQACRDRLLGIFTHNYISNFKNKVKPKYLKSAEYILKRNILWGDALSLKTPDEKAEPIIFSEWSAINGSLMKRRDFSLAKLLENPPLEGFNLFSDLGDDAFIPTSVADYPLIHFLELGNKDDN